MNRLDNAIETIIDKYQTNTKEQKKFKTTLNRVLEYQEEVGQEFKLLDVNQIFTDRFHSWGEDRYYKVSYLNAILKRIRRAVNYVYDNDDRNLVQVSKTLNSFKLPKVSKAEKIILP